MISTSLFFFISRGSVLANIVLTFVINAHMTTTDAASRVVERLDSNDIEGLNISTITVLGKRKQGWLNNESLERANLNNSCHYGLAAIL